MGYVKDYLSIVLGNVKTTMFLLSCFVSLAFFKNLGFSKIIFILRKRFKYYEIVFNTMRNSKKKKKHKRNKEKQVT